MEQERTVNRNYVFTEKQLKEKLGIVGDIKEMGLWSGRSPQMEKDGESKDNDNWFIQTKNTELYEEEQEKEE